MVKYDFWGTLIMLEKENLRKADVYSGAIICLFGLWVVLQALKMPMKDSWGVCFPGDLPTVGRLHNYAARRTIVPNRTEDHWF